MGHHINIWDTDSPPQLGDGHLLLWRSYYKSVSETVISIPGLVEEHSDVLKSRYLSWIYDLGESDFGGKKVVDHLEIRPNFSFWWMTLISSKCNYSESPQIAQAIRLMAFDLWASSNNISSITLTSSNDALAECLDVWSKTRGIKYEHKREKILDVSQSNIRRIYNNLPNKLKAIVYIPRYFWTHWPLRGAGLSEWKGSKADITFFSYLFNLEPDSRQQDRFRSKFWTRLPDELSKNHCKTNWLHIFCADSSHPTPNHGRIKIDRFNKMGLGEQVHTALEAFLSWSIVYNTLKDWFGILKFAKILEPKISSIDSEGVHLWPLYKEEWYSSLCGVPSIAKLLELNLFEAAVRTLPKQRAGVYLYEQQSWELALISSWKSERHGMLVGAQHATMIFWDMRYYHDPRSYDESGSECLPMPDVVAANSTITVDALKKSGYPKANIVEVEALRYLHLCDPKEVDKSVGITQTKNTVLRILVVGDYLASNTKIQMDLLVKALISSTLDVSITVKPHPACLIDPANYPESEMNVTMEPLENLLADCDLAYSSPVTSAAVDAYCLGVPVITVLDANALNLSPLRNCDDVYFVSTPLELSDALHAITSTDTSAGVKREFFTLDPELPRWKELLLEGGAQK